MERSSPTIVGIAAVLAGGGALTFALFPFLLPTVVLLGVLALPLLPLAVVGALAAGVYVSVRGAVRLARGDRRRTRRGPDDQLARPAHVRSEKSAVALR